LDRAIQRFLWNGGNLPYDQLAALRELLETAQHYWEVVNRLHKTASPPLSNDLPVLLPPTNLGSSGETATLYRFIQLLRDGTVTANPYPTRSWVTPRGASVTIATVFQYRAHRSWHRWQFWLDAGSSLWLTGVDSLLGAPIFLQGWNGRRMTESDQFLMGEERLVRTLKDLLGRTGERIYLCHSELGISGQEQVGPLLALINTLTPLE
ncbi:MAG: recombinase family protein, partial [Synechococcales cyanobacterium]